ncbi:LysR family transcriptional regulator [Lacimicrobium sp. SS2-24]|uniref:LysR family transcriptional regulator n=1 Tax=Lacimicrobium sp. SS2-24 TaxID=2005569 RepID=UPI000B4A8B70|nr:LysR family transcriptional regulator [Lacimicrobium sp. SS2-24]
MNKLRGMFLFTRLADLGSFAAVAEEIGSTSSMVSKEIQKLEHEIGARLVHRSTRKMKLTSIGEGYLNRCKEILSQIRDAESYVQQMQTSMRGSLRINVPMVLGMTDLGLVLSDYMKAFPDVKLDVHLGDEDIDLIEHGFDLGFRASSKQFDSNYIGKRLKAFSYHVCGSREYLAAHPKIQRPEDLKQHNCFIYSYFKGGNDWPIAGGVKVDGSLRVNNTLFMRDAIESGLGVGFLPSFVAAPGLQSGNLIEVLEEFNKPKLTLYALYPNRKHTLPILTKCIDFIENWFERNERQTRYF